MSTSLSPVAAAPQIQMDIHRSTSGMLRVAVVGEVDMCTAPILREELVRAMHEQTFAVLDIDLAGVTFLDCAGVSALVSLRDAAVQTGRQMRVGHPQPIVRLVLELTGMMRALDVTVAAQPSESMVAA
jgi:anti-anti-sigma factor